MSVPLRKDQTEENLTTADLAQTRRPSPVETMRSKPPMSESEPLERAENAETAEHNMVAKADPVVNNTADATPLFPNNELEGLRNQWNSVQGAFVDEPRRAVEQADRTRRISHEAFSRSLCRGAFQARTTMGPWRQRLHRRPANRAATLPFLLSPALVDLNSPTPLAIGTGLPMPIPLSNAVCQRK